ALIKLEICGLFYHLPFIAGFTNLHELRLSTTFDDHWSGVSKLRHLIFPQLQIFSFKNCTSADGFAECLEKFFKNNGKNIKELYLDDVNRLNLTIAESCPNLKLLTTCILCDDLKKIFNNCQYL